MIMLDDNILNNIVGGALTTPKGFPAYPAQTGNEQDITG